jgi:uncharacterized protein YdaU (DUF1376 family)
MNYYERHIGDYLKDTAHLSLLEHGVYGRLLDVYYTREGPLPVNQVDRLIGVRSKDERAALAAVLDEFFALDGDVLRHPRCEREIARYQDKQEKAKRSANARWENKSQHTERNANAMRTHSEGNALQTPVTSNQTPVTIKKEGDSGSAQAQTPPPPYRGEANEAEIHPKAKVMLAADWELPEPWGVDAENLGWPAKSILHEAEKFRQFYTVGKGGGTRRGLKGWRQSWSNWLSNAEKFAPIRRVV